MTDICKLVRNRDLAEVLLKLIIRPGDHYVINVGYDFRACIWHGHDEIHGHRRIGYLWVTDNGFLKFSTTYMGNAPIFEQSLFTTREIDATDPNSFEIMSQIILDRVISERSNMIGISHDNIIRDSSIRISSEIGFNSN